MSSALDEVLRRRAALQALGDLQRRELALHARTLRQPLGLAARMEARVRWLREHPAWLAALAAVALVVRPRRLFKWSGPLWAGWRAWKTVRRWMDGAA